MGQETTPRRGSLVGRIFGALLRFFLYLFSLAVIAAAVAATLYYGVPWLYRQYIEPVQSNSARLAALEQRVDEEVEKLRQDNEDLVRRMQTVENDVKALDAALTKLNMAQETVQSRLTALESQLGDLQETLDELRQASQQDSATLEERLSTVEDTVNQVRGELDRLRGQLLLAQAAQYLLKARVLLAEENLGEARRAVQLAAAMVEEAIPLLPADSERLRDIHSRLAGLDALIAARSLRTIPTLEALAEEITELATGGIRLAPPAATPTPTPAATP